MDPSTASSGTLDLLYLTFNCAKNLLNVVVFANHLSRAFSQNATALPDVVVFSLQEVAPMGHSFVGGYFLNPYIARFEEAVNLAALRYEDEQDLPRAAQGDESPTAPTRPTGPEKPYSLVKTGNVGYTAILLFARDASRVQDVQDAEVGFGAAEMGNKGAVGLRFLYDGGKNNHTEMTFVAMHLAAMEWNLPKRNANWATIVRGMTFEDPETVLKSFQENHARTRTDEAETQSLLHDDHDEHHADLQSRLHDISIYKPSSHLFVAGDLNYRISTVSPRPSSPFPSLDPSSENHYPKFLRRDQLTRERLAGRTLHGLSEAAVTFPPTYKYDILPGTSEADVDWEFAPHRYPSWTDRVLYLDVPATGASSAAVDVRAYDAMPVMRMSDHRPVYLRASVPLITPDDLRAAAAESASSSTDPRVRLPVEIDPEAWGRRAAARRKEVMAGWTMFLGGTQQGALILASVLAVGAAAYWMFGPGGLLLR